MKKENRIRKRRDFLRVANSGIFFKTDILLAQMSREELARVRVGFSVSKKVGNAVTRNRIKRRFRAAASEILKENEFLERDYVFIAKKAICETSWNDLLETMKFAIKSLNKKIKKCKK